MHLPITLMLPVCSYIMQWFSWGLQFRSNTSFNSFISFPLLNAITPPCINHYYVTVRPPSLVRRNGSKNFKPKVLQALGCSVYVLVFFLAKKCFLSLPKKKYIHGPFCTDLLLIFDILAQNGIRRQCFWFSVLNDGVSSGLFLNINHFRLPFLVYTFSFDLNLVMFMTSCILFFISYLLCGY